MDVFGEDIILSVICLESNLVLLIQHVNIIEHLLCAGLHHAKKDTPVFMPHMAPSTGIVGGRSKGSFGGRCSGCRVQDVVELTGSSRGKHGAIMWLC